MKIQLSVAVAADSSLGYNSSLIAFFDVITNSETNDGTEGQDAPMAVDEDSSDSCKDLLCVEFCLCYFQ